MKKAYVEKPHPFKFTADSASLFLASWCRISNGDGSTIAYAPDRITAQQIADLFNKS